MQQINKDSRIVELDQQAIGSFIAKWAGTKGGAERANFPLFMGEMLTALQLPQPDAAEQGTLIPYQYEGPVKGGSLHGDGTGKIDLYRKGSFVMEAKQSLIPQDKQNQPELYDPSETATAAPSGAKYDVLMQKALKQAKNYAVNLPANHDWPPFLIICDVGRAFELYFDYAGNGRGYAFFPDRQSYRIPIAKLAEAETQSLLRDIWLTPKSLDPKLKAVEVTRGIAKRLASVSEWLEGKTRFSGDTDLERSLSVEQTTMFIMRNVFCMFAEDIGLLPSGKFTAFLDRARRDEELFEVGLSNLWQIMANETIQPRYSIALESKIRYFNGGLFENSKTYSLSIHDIGELYEAARADWRKVEPAIFGTMLEQALTPAQRAQLGAHYTPRPYVERLVRATIMEVLEDEWLAVLQMAEDDGNKPTVKTKSAARAFHQRLAKLRILDPACGTGNFLYVAMELIMRLEADVLDLLDKLGVKAEAQVGPDNFYGLELNSRAAVITELVLWIGWLRFRVINDPEDVPDPVLRKTGTINFGAHGGYDAVLRLSPTGVADTANPMIPDWPEVDFIIGNPPFIGGKDLRAKLGGDYAEALWKANPRVPKSADFVMQWWDRAAHTLIAKDSPLIRFGFVTTNSITQEFSRRVMANYMDSGELSLHMAIPDHPWIKPPKAEKHVKGTSRTAKGKKAEGPAAVRIAMTVATKGKAEGRFIEVLRESALDSDEPKVELSTTTAAINSNLSISADVSQCAPLLANAVLGYRGVQLIGAGFIVSPAEAAHLGLGKREGLEKHIRPYLNGRDMVQRTRGMMVIDLLGMDEKEVRQRFPEVYQHVMQTVKPERDVNRRDTYKKNWWIHGEPRRDLRPALADLPRYIATVETTKHRIFQFLDASILPDNMLVAIGSADAFHLGVLSSGFHVSWALGSGGSLEDRPRYTKSQCFDPFPFPDATDAQRAAIAELAEELDETRKLAMAEVAGLTMTELYNLRDKLRAGTFADYMEEDRAKQARAGIVQKLHDDLDAAVADAYGWADDWKAGKLPPSEIVARLVALNQERAKEEAAGKIRWLRPDYQIGRVTVPTKK